MQQNLIVDYLVMSFKVSDKKQDCFMSWLNRRIGFPADAINIRSFYGLQNCRFFSGVKIHWQAGLVILDCSGKGCRTVEELNPGWSWESWLKLFEPFITKPIKGSDFGGEKGIYSVHISRIDLACDLLDDTRVTIPFLQRYVAKEKFISKSNYHTCIIGNHEQAIYFGSPRSDRRLRIYDKALEQGLKDKNWVRFEFQLRDENATSFYLNLFRTCSGDMARCYYGMMRDFLRFVTGSNNHDGHQVRLRTCPFWARFLHGCRKIKQLYLPGNHYNIGRATKIFERQCSSTALTLLRASDGDASQLLQIAEAAKLNKKQEMALQEFQKEQDDAEEQALWDAAYDNSQRILLSIGQLKDYVARDDAEMQEQKRIEREKHWKSLSIEE